MNHEVNTTRILSLNSLFSKFPNNSVKLSNLIIHFDVVTLSFWYGYTKSLINCLNSHFGYNSKVIHIGSKEKNDNGKSTYTKQRKYERNGKLMAEVIYDQDGICPDLIKIHPPHDELFTLIGIFFADKQSQETISLGELAFDFYSDNPPLFQYDFESIWWHKHVRGEPFVFRDLKNGRHTSYTTGFVKEIGGENIMDRKRKHLPSTGGKTYEKDKLGEYEEQDGEEYLVEFESTSTFTRMEFTFRRTCLERMGINKLEDLHKLWELDLSKLFAFSSINYFDEKEKACLVSSLHKRIIRPLLKQRGRKRGNLERTPQLVRRHIESRLTDVAPSDPWRFPPERQTLMEQLHALKGFLRPYAERAGISKIDHSKFLRLAAPDLYNFVINTYQKEGTKCQA